MIFSIVGNLGKAGLQEAVVPLLQCLERADARYVIDSRILELLERMSGTARASARSHEECLAQGEMIVAFGGDGTFLGIAREVGDRSTPILGVNLGKLGFLAELTPEEIPEAVEEILEGRYIVEDRLVLEATSPAVPGRVVHAVNDVVIDKSRSPRLISLDTYIDGAFAVTYRGDGLIISTPTGSTAYALSTGGPIVTPTSHVLGITPISPHTLSGRPLIIPDRSSIRLAVHPDAEEVLFSADGRVEAFLRPPVELTLRKASYPVRLVKRTNRSYFDVLRAKLLWGQDARSSRA